MKNTVLEILVPDNDPNGLKLVKLAGWIGRAFVVPRSDVKHIKSLKEANYPAVYFLFGESEEGPTVYIGQTDNFDRRISQQTSAKDYWNTSLIFTGEADVDVQYLERICTTAAAKAGRYGLMNSTGTPGRTISDFKKAANDDFFEKMKFVISLLGYPVFQETPKEQQIKEIYYLEDVQEKDASGKGALLPSNEFIVFAGSLARKAERPAFIKKGGNIKRQELLEKGVLKGHDEHSYIFTQDYIFTSPSAACGAVIARSCNGWTSWKDKNGKTLDENKRQQP